MSFRGKMCSYLFLLNDCQWGGGALRIREVHPPKYLRAVGRVDMGSVGSREGRLPAPPW